MQPLAVTVAVPKVRSAKSVNPVVPPLVGSTLVKALPPAVQFVPLTWLVVVNAVVAAPNVAELVYKANLKALPPVEKLCVA